MIQPGVCTMHLPDSIRNISIIECNEPLVDLRLAGGILFGPPPECSDTESHYCLVREGVYRRLLRVQRSLPAGLFLRLYEGLRSLRVQKQLFDEELVRVRLRSGPISDAAAFDEAVKLVSPVSNADGSRNIPSHSTGGAVDVEIVNADGEVIDFGMEVKDWRSVEPQYCLPALSGLAPAAAANRRLLAMKMQQAGFVQYAHEWWHFSYGDRYWAAETGASHPIYGMCEGC